MQNDQIAAAVTSYDDGDNGITVTGTSGALKHSATVTLTVPCKAPRCT